MNFSEADARIMISKYQFGLVFRQKPGGLHFEEANLDYKID